MLSFEKLVDAVREAVVKANETLMDANIGILDKYFKPSDVEGVLEAKMVSIKMPQQTIDGMEEIEVKVPLITMVPMTTSRIKKLKFSADLEIYIKDDKLQVDFNKLKTEKNLFKNKKNSDIQTHNAHIELEIEPTESSEGIKRLIEGYEKQLRAQIPN